jgi:hypothetical protein
VVRKDIDYHHSLASKWFPLLAQEVIEPERKKGEFMRTSATKWSLILLCFSMAGAVGGGLYEHMVLMPLWASSPPASFAIIQADTGVPLQNFWIPVHVAITVFLLLSLVLAWREKKARLFLLIGFTSYLIMRVWSIFFFIPEMLSFQKVPLDSTASEELVARVAQWTTLTWYREPLDAISFLSFLLALYGLKRLGDFTRQGAAP